MIDEEPALLSARNDGMVNSFNPVQLSAWRANVDMQYIVSRRKVIEYCTKYVTKGEPRSQSLKDTFTNIVRSLRDGNRSLKAVQKLLISSVGERDFSAQETCHLLLQLPMFKASREFVVLSLDGSRAVEEHLQQEERATAPSILDHYIVRPSTPQFNSTTLLDFARQYTMPKELNAEPKRRSKRVIVIARPYCSPDPDGSNYEQYCRQSLMQHKCFRQMSELLAGCETYAEAYTSFLQSGNVPASLADDIFRLQQHEHQQSEDAQSEDVPRSDQPSASHPRRAVEEWMLLCQHNSDLHPSIQSQDFDWTEAAQQYPNIEEVPTFITRQRQAAAARVFTTSANPQNLQGTQFEVYLAVKSHFVPLSTKVRRGTEDSEVTAKTVKLADLPALAVRQKVTVVCKVVTVSPPEDIVTKADKKLTLQNCTIGDSGGCCKLTLWEDQVGRLKEGQTYTMDGISVREYNLHKSLSAGPDSTFTQVEDLGTVQEEYSDDKDSSSTFTTIEGEIDVIVSVDEYTSCRTCKAKVTPANEIIGECTKCGSVMKLAKCTNAATAKVVLEGDQDRVVTIFTTVIDDLIKEVNGDTVAMKLLSAPPHSFSIDKKDIVYAVKKL